MTGANSVLVTGASSGMGQVISKTLSSRGEKVFAAMREMSGRNAASADHLRAHNPGNPITPVDLDVADDASAARGVRSMAEQAGRIDILIHCAGVMWTGATEAFSIAQVQTMVETNLIGPFRLYQAVLPHMRRQGSGLIVTITSTCGRLVPPGFGLYSATKFGLEAMAEGLAYEVAGLGIDAVIVEPGPFATNLMANQQKPAHQDIVAEYGELGRLDATLAERTWPLVQSSGVSTDPQDVADLVGRLIDQPQGTRPLRTTVGMDSGVTELNRSIESYQQEFLKTLQFENLR